MRRGTVLRLNNYEYIGQTKIVDTVFALNILGSNDFAEFHKIFEGISCLEDKQRATRLSDTEAAAIIMDALAQSNITDIQELEESKKTTLLKSLKTKGLSIRQISRLTGISKSLVEGV